MATYKNKSLEELIEEITKLKKQLDTVKERNNSLKQSEENLRVTLNSIGDAVVATDTVGRITGMNPVAEKLTGWNFEDADGKPLYDIFNIANPKTREKAENPVKRLLQTGKIGGLINHNLLISKDGTESQIAESCAPIKDNEGNINGVVLVFRDVTEQCLMRERIAASEERLRSLIEQSPLSIQIMDIDGMTVQVNRAWEKLWGVTWEEFSKFEYNMLKDEQLNELAILSYIKKGFAGKPTSIPPIEYDAVDTLGTGYKRWVSGRIYPLRDETGNISNVILMHEDITQRKQAEEHNRFLSSVVEQSADGMAISDMKGNLLFANNKWVSMHGYEKEKELLGQNLSIFHSKKQLKDDVGPFNRKVMGKGSFTGEVWHIRKDGAIFPTQMTTTLLRDKNNNPIAIAGVATDITDRKQAEEALQESEGRLRVKLDYILSPDKDVKNVSLTDLMDLKNLQQIQDAFAAANNVASIISDVDGNPITKASNFCGVCEIIRSTKNGNRNCIKSDKILGEKAKALLKPAYEKCLSCGFVDASAPIIVGGKHIANWLIGQSNVMSVGKERIEAYAKEIGADTKKMLDAFETMPQITLAKFEQVLDLLWYFAKELSTLGYNNLKLTKNITEIKQAEEKEKEKRKYIDLLSTTAMQFVEFPQNKNIYTFIGERLQEFTEKDSYVIVNSIENDDNILTTRAIVGMGKLFKKVAGLIGRNPMGMSYDAKDEDLVYLSDSKLHLYKGGLYGLSLKTIPKTVSKLIEKLLNIKSILTIGLIKDNKLFGSIIILLKQDANEHMNKQLIETFVKQASIAIQKRQVEEALKGSELQYRTVAEFTYDWEYWKNPDNTLRYVSPACKRVSGYSANEFITDPQLLDKIILDSDKGDCEKHNNENEKQALRELQFRIRRKDGKISWIEHVCRPVVDEEGIFLGYRASNRDISYRKLAEEKIINSLKEKDVLLKEIHHRVKNNMQLIMSLLNLQSNNIENTDTLNAFTESKARIRAMSLVHEVLYQSANLGKVDLNEYINRLIQTTTRALGNDSTIINYALDIEKINLSIDDAIPLALILNELLTNVYKYAFKGMKEGKVDISIKVIADKKIELRFADNGIGLPKDIDLQYPATLGLQIVSDLVQGQLDGTLKQINDNGSKFIIKFDKLRNKGQVEK